MFRSTTERRKTPKSPKNAKKLKAKIRVAETKHMPKRVLKFPLPSRSGVVGKVLVCGLGDIGQLGSGDIPSNLEFTRPVLVGNLTNVVDIAAGGMHNLVLTHDGRVFSFGCNDEGALGRDSSEEGSEFEPRPINLPNRAVKICAGDSHSACLLEDGSVFAWGSFRDSRGNMGLTLEGMESLPVNLLPNVMCRDIASGADHLVILTIMGKVYTVGCAEQGQLGRVSKRSISGEGRRGKLDLLVPGLVSINRGKLIDSIWATTYCTFLKEAYNGQIWAFGLNNYKQLVHNEDVLMIINPIAMKFSNIKAIAGGQHHTIVLKNDGSVYAVGRRDYGRLGLGQLDKDVDELTKIASLDGETIIDISSGEAQSFAITDKGKLYAWGMGSNYQLGIGSDNDVLEPTIVVNEQIEGKQIIRASSGGQHSIFLMKDELQPSSVIFPQEVINSIAAKEMINITMENDEMKKLAKNGRKISTIEQTLRMDKKINVTTKKQLLKVIPDHIDNKQDVVADTSRGIRKIKKIMKNEY